MNKTRGIVRLPATVPSTSKNRTALAVPSQRAATSARSGRRTVLESPACPTPRHPAGRAASESVNAAFRAGFRRPVGTTA